MEPHPKIAQKEYLNLKNLEEKFFIPYPMEMSREGNVTIIVSPK